MVSPDTHVALVTRSLMIGGAQNQIVRLSQSFDRSRLRMTIVLLVNDEARDLVGEVPPDVEVVISPHARRSPRVLRWLARELAARHVDVVHSFLWSADATAALSRSLFGGPPLVTSERGDRGAPGYSWRRNRFDRAVTFPAAACVVANSTYGARILIASGCPEAKVRVIANGIDVAAIDAIGSLDIRRRFGWADDVTIVGCVARLVDYKGVDFLLRALAVLIQDDSRYRAVLIGEGPLRANLERLAVALGVADHVRFLGRQRPAIPWIKNFDVAVLTTTTASEHCSNSILEYLACGVPVVTTEVGGNPELIGANERGLLVPPHDTTALAGAIRQLSRDERLRRRFATAGRAKIAADHATSITTGRFTDAWLECAART